MDLNLHHTSIWRTGSKDKSRWVVLRRNGATCLKHNPDFLSRWHGQIHRPSISKRVCRKVARPRVRSTASERAIGRNHASKHPKLEVSTDDLHDWKNISLMNQQGVSHSRTSPRLDWTSEMVSSYQREFSLFSCPHRHPRGEGWNRGTDGQIRSPSWVVENWGWWQC